MIKTIITLTSLAIATISGLAFIGEGLQLWFWQFFAIAWIISSYRKDKKIEKLTKLIKNVKK